MNTNELRKLLNEASPLPWFWDSYATIHSEPESRKAVAFVEALPDDAPEEAYENTPEYSVCNLPRIGGDTATSQGQKDARLIVAAVNSLPVMLTRIAELEGQVNELNNLLRAVGWGQGEIDYAATVLEENEKRIAELETALTPFAAQAARYKTRRAVPDQSYADGLVLGDFFRAADVMNTKEDE